nr:hypothetical protein GCM10025730_34840 [Promicromonospora thailandica]
MRVSADVDERTLRETYLRAFQRVVTTARPATLMTSYNRVNGTHPGEDRRLTTEVLRDEWGFDGLVVSDWGAVHDRLAGLRAGLDLEMPGAGEARVREIVAAVRSGALDPADVDRSATRVVTLALAAQAARDRDGGDRPTDGAPGTWHDDAHHALAREAASRAIVLLKNDGGLLPLSPRTRLAVIGELARTPRYQGAGSSQVVPTLVEDALTAIRDSAADVVFAPGYTAEPRDARRGAGRRGGRKGAAALADEAVAAARDAGVVLFFAGLPRAAEAEGATASTSSSRWTSSTCSTGCWRSTRASSWCCRTVRWCDCPGSPTGCPRSSRAGCSGRPVVRRRSTCCSAASTPPGGWPRPSRCGSRTPPPGRALPGPACTSPTARGSSWATAGTTHGT